MRLLRVMAFLGITMVPFAGMAAQAKPLKDQAILDQFARSNPCPAVVPAIWLKPDSTVGHSRLCPLVAATAAHLSTSPDSAQRWIAAHAVCTVVVGLTAEDMNDHSSGAIWSVKFVTADYQEAGAIFDRQTGTVKYQRFQAAAGTTRAKLPCRLGA